MILFRERELCQTEKGRKRTVLAQRFRAFAFQRAQLPLPSPIERRRMNCAQYCDHDCGPRARIDRLIRRSRMVLLPTAQPGPAGDVSPLLLCLSTFRPRRVRTCAHVYRCIRTYTRARSRYSLARTSWTRGLLRSKNVARARRALGDHRPPSVLNNGHYVPGHNSMGYHAPAPTP